VLLSSLEKSLCEAGVVLKPLSPEESRQSLLKLGDVDRFSDLIGTFYAMPGQINETPRNCAH